MMKRVVLLAVSGLFTVTLFAGTAAYVDAHTYEDGSGRIAGVSYCLPWGICQD